MSVCPQTERAGVCSVACADISCFSSVLAAVSINRQYIVYLSHESFCMCLCSAHVHLFIVVVVVVVKRATPVKSPRATFFALLPLRNFVSGGHKRKAKSNPFCWSHLVRPQRVMYWVVATNIMYSFLLVAVTIF